jgi:DNA-binding winged helix-turn-helix (wHTH) protein
VQNWPVIWRSGDVELDADRLELRRGGQVVPVEPQVFGVLVHLVEHRDRVVSHRELLETVWADRAVTPSALASRVKAARRALGDDGQRQEMIATVHGRGYRFVGVIDEVTPLLPTRRSTDPVDHGGERVDNEPWPLVGRRDLVDEVVQLFEERLAGGVALVGPRGIGLGRLANACADAIAARSRAVVERVLPSDGGVDIAFAPVAHLLPAEIVAAESGAPDLARTNMLRRAVEAVAVRWRPDVPVLMVDDLEHLEPLSAAFVDAIGAAGLAFVIAVTRRPTTDRSEQRAGKAGWLHEIRVDPLSELDVDVLLYRVLGGPVDPRTLEQLSRATRRHPALLRDVVTTSVATGALRRVDGVWTAVEPITSSAAGTWPPPELGAEARAGAELIATGDHLALQVAIDLAGDAAVDELDGAGLLLVEQLGTEWTVTVADPLVRAAILGSMGSLRRRRVETELAGLLSRERIDPRSAAAAVEARTALRLPFDDALVLAFARRAMLEGDLASAARLVHHLGHESPESTVVRAELAFASGQWRTAERLFDLAEPERLSSPDLALVLRRRATIRYERRGERREVVDALASDARSQRGRTAHALTARRVSMLADLGHADDVVAEVDDLLEDGGTIGIEAALAVATARAQRGELALGHASLDRIEQLLARLPKVWAPEPRAAVAMVRALLLSQGGRLDDAARTVRAEVPHRGPHALGYAPVFASQIELLAGRPRAAANDLHYFLSTVQRDRFPHYVDAAETTLAQAEARLGRRDSFAWSVESGIEALDRLDGDQRWVCAVAAAELATYLDDGPAVRAVLADCATEASDRGATLREAEVLVALAALDPTGAVADQVAPSIDAFSTHVGGAWWLVRAQLVRALAAQSGIGAALGAYRAIGYAGAVEAVIVGRRERSAVPA